jgi:hypothetical protein
VPRERMKGARVACPSCGGKLSKVIRSKGLERTRECLDLECRVRWLTEEVTRRRVRYKRPAA